MISSTAGMGTITFEPVFYIFLALGIISFFFGTYYAVKEWKKRNEKNTTPEG